jgi:hypothetical protein
MVVDPKLARPSGIAERRLVVSLLTMTFLLWIGASAIVPLLPTYLHGHGASTGLVGVVMASYFALSVVTQYPAGRLTDRIGARAVIVGGSRSSSPGASVSPCKAAHCRRSPTAPPKASAPARRPLLPRR